MGFVIVTQRHSGQRLIIEIVQRYENDHNPTLDESATNSTATIIHEECPRWPSNDHISMTARLNIAHVSSAGGGGTFPRLEASDPSMY